MHACMCKYVLLRTTYEYRVYMLILNNINRGRADAYTERKNSERTASLIGSKLAEVS